MSRREKKAVDEGPGWLATYGDLVTLLLAFFVMLFAVSSVEAQKFEAFLAGLGQFDNAAAAPGVWPPSAAEAPIFAMNADIGQGALEKADATEEALREREEIEADLAEAVEAAGLTDALELRADPRGIAVALATDNVLFESGSAELTAPGDEVIGHIAAVLRTLHYDVTIEGHTDNTPLNRAGYTNWHLSTDRAVSVVQAFALRHGIEPTRLSAVGYGEYKPLDQGDTPEARARNRRVEIVVHTESQQRLAETSPATAPFDAVDATPPSFTPVPVTVAPALGN
ncbi:MAG: flagellar motor protein MotB [Acidimicrobiales bacterium]